MYIRTIQEDEFRDFLAMGEFAFQYELSDEDVESRKALLALENCFALYEDDRMASKLTIHPMEIWLAGKRMSMGGIAGVASWPEHRRKGHVKALMHHSLEVMRERGQYVSMLHPFSFQFYRKFGWELTHAVKKYEIKPDQLTTENKDVTGKVIRIEHSIERLNAIYEQYAADCSGMLKRTNAWWDHSILHNKRDIVAVYQDENGIDQGYMIYRVKKDHMEIDEWINLTADAKKAMLHFVANHDSMVEKITLHPPIDENFTYYMVDPKIKQETSSYFMSRIVDVKRFLEAYPFQWQEESMNVIIQVSDPFAAWNDGTYIIKQGENLEGNSVTHHPLKEGTSCTHEPKRGIICSINELSTLFFHFMKPRELADQGLIKGNDKEILQLESLLTAHRPFLYDFF